MTFNGDIERFDDFKWSIVRELIKTTNKIREKSDPSNEIENIEFFHIEFFGEKRL